MGRGEWASQRAGNGWMSVMGAVYGQIGGRGGEGESGGGSGGQWRGKREWRYENGRNCLLLHEDCCCYIYIYISLSP